ncbi:MAG: CRISPR-associated endonuclease/helicase Cas3 [bacterium ADurb.Bin374]|nr:MAG: CRISPR-associated endonuclease/helicase Cas3 [bacterium ADurb.Bin374]
MFWGKLRAREGGLGIESLSLDDHCCDVAACVEALLRLPLIRGMLAACAEFADFTPAHVARLCVFAGLHDIGKFNNGFQRKADPAARATAGHVRELLAICNCDDGRNETFKLCDSISFDELETWGSPETAFYLMCACFAHHGQPIPIGMGFRSDIWKEEGKRDPFQGMAGLMDKLRRWFPEAFQPGLPVFPACPEFQHAFNGLVTLADWIASDTRFFPFISEIPGEDRLTMARRKAKDALGYIGIDIHSSASCLPANPGFEMISCFQARPPQQTIADLPVPASGSLTILEAETGAGKTEAALHRFLQLLKAGVVGGMYFALPTRTAATQIFDRVRNCIERAFPEQASRPHVVLAVPGYVRMDDSEGRRLPGFEVLWDDDPNGAKKFNGWAAEHPKRFLAGSIVVGTIDQVLMGGLKISHAHLRQFMVFRHFLVVDEVHASDIYMHRLLETVIKRHLRAGGHALLMSATLGSETRERYLSLVSDDVSSLPDPEIASRTAFPMVWMQERSRGRREAPVVEQFSQKQIGVFPEPISEDPRAIADLALELASEGAKVLVIRNTVRDCVATQSALEQAACAADTASMLFACQQKPAPHHARYAREDRETLDRALEERFGKNRTSGACVAVATQTVQQSLDIDADVLLTDLCPVDVLLQRFGRLHRHRDRPDRPADFTSPKAFVLVPRDRRMEKWIDRRGEARGPHGFGCVYEDLCVLEATWSLLEQHPTIEIPRMNRFLVEQATHSKRLREVVERLGGSWKAHHQKIRVRGPLLLFAAD